MRLRGKNAQVEVLQPGESSRLADIERLAYVLDAFIAVPGTNFRIGVDALLGLLPGIGDTLGAALSSYLIYRAAQEGFPVRVLLRMSWNVALDSLVGVVPLFGDLFDAAFKANQRNLRIMRAHLASGQALRDRPRDPQRVARLFFLLALATLVLLTALVGALLVGIAALFLRVFS